MKIKATQEVEVEINDFIAKQIVRIQLLKIGGWTKDNFIDDIATVPALMVKKEYATSHSWIEHIFVRDATPLDLAINEILINL